MRLKVGPVSATFNGDIEVLGLDAERRELRLSGRGGDSKGTSSASMDLTAALEPGADGGTVLAGRVVISLTGKFASFAGRMLESISERLLSQFVERFETRVPAGGEGVEAEAARRRLEEGPQALSAIGLLWGSIKAFFRKLFGGG